MKDKDFKRMIRLMDTEAAPPQGLKEEILSRIYTGENDRSPALSLVEGLFFRRPLLTACLLSFVISGIFRAVMGSGYTHILVNWIGIR